MSIAVQHFVLKMTPRLPLVPSEAHYNVAGRTEIMFQPGEHQATISRLVKLGGHLDPGEGATKFSIFDLYPMVWFHTGLRIWG